jgi:hypothetical protein
MDERVNINCGLWLILNLAINDSAIPTITANPNCIAKNNGIPRYGDNPAIKKFAIIAPNSANLR